MVNQGRKPFRMRLHPNPLAHKSPTHTENPGDASSKNALQNASPRPNSPRQLINNKPLTDYAQSHTESRKMRHPWHPGAPHPVPPATGIHAPFDASSGKHPQNRCNRRLASGQLTNNKPLTNLAAFPAESRKMRQIYPLSPTFPATGIRHLASAASAPGRSRPASTGAN